MLRNCRGCGKPFTPTPTAKRCRDCIELELEQADIVFKFVRSKPDSTLDEIEEATDVPKSNIIKLIRSGRLQFAAGAMPICKVCSEEINRRQVNKPGYCNGCAEKVDKMQYRRAEEKELARKLAEERLASKGTRYGLGSGK